MGISSKQITKYVCNICRKIIETEHPLYGKNYIAMHPVIPDSWTDLGDFGIVCNEHKLWDIIAHIANLWKRYRDGVIKG